MACLGCSGCSLHLCLCDLSWCVCLYVFYLYLRVLFSGGWIKVFGVSVSENLLDVIVCVLVCFVVVWVKEVLGF